MSVFRTSGRQANSSCQDPLTQPWCVPGDPAGVPRGGLAFYRVQGYIETMEIENVSTAMSQDKVREEAAAKTQAMAQQQAEAEAAGLAKLMESAEVVTDSEVGNNVDLLG